MSTFWLVFQPLRYRCFPFLFHYHQWSLSTESLPFSVTCKQKYNFFFWTQLFNLSLFFKRRGTMSSVLGMLGPFQPPLGDTTPAFSFSLHLHLFLQGLPTPCCSPLFPITSLHNPSTPPNRALGFLSSLCLHCLPCSRVGGSSAPSSLPVRLHSCGSSRPRCSTTSAHPCT